MGMNCWVIDENCMKIDLIRGSHLPQRERERERERDALMLKKVVYSSIDI